MGALAELRQAVKELSDIVKDLKVTVEAQETELQGYREHMQLPSTTAEDKLREVVEELVARGEPYLHEAVKTHMQQVNFTKLIQEALEAYDVTRWLDEFLNMDEVTSEIVARYATELLRDKNFKAQLLTNSVEYIWQNEDLEYLSERIAEALLEKARVQVIFGNQQEEE